jgi:RNA polymerase sigma-54 factor
MVNISQRLSQQLRQSPQQVLLSSLLQLPVISLEQKIRLELEVNPLLEQVDEMELEQEQEQEEEVELEAELEQKDEKEKDAEAAETQAAEESEGEKDEVDWDTILGDEDTYEHRAPRDNSSEEYERPEVASTTLPEHLLTQLHMTKLDERQFMIGEYLIWNINEDGYLSCSIEVVVQNLQVEPEEVEEVLHVIQHFDPVGIGARNLQECLLVQLEEKLPREELALEIVRSHFDDFTNKRFEKIVKKLNITLDEVKHVIDVIVKLNPKPGEGYVTFQDSMIVPDILVKRDEDEFQIILNDSNVPHLRINNAYKKLLLDKKTSDRETKEFVKKRLESARWLINSIHQRRMTIQRVMEAIIQKQFEFFDKGPAFIKPMILKDIADEIGMDISTVSRVTNGKYLQCEHGVFELKYFFSEAIKTDVGEDVSNRIIKQRIKEIIDAESPNHPLNDQKIAEMLKTEGFNVARRTVAKYREQMMLPVSRLRRKI